MQHIHSGSRFLLHAVGGVTAAGPRLPPTRLAAPSAGLRPAFSASWALNPHQTERRGPRDARGLFLHHHTMGAEAQSQLPSRRGDTKSRGCPGGTLFCHRDAVRWLAQGSWPWL